MAEEERFQQGKKSEKDQEKAKDIRLKAMEKLSQTKKVPMTRQKRVEE